MIEQVDGLGQDWVAGDTTEWESRLGEFDDDDDNDVQLAFRNIPAEFRSATTDLSRMHSRVNILLDLEYEAGHSRLRHSLVNHFNLRFTGQVPDEPIKWPRSQQAARK